MGGIILGSTEDTFLIRSCTTPNHPKRGNMLKHKNTPYGNFCVKMFINRVYTQICVHAPLVNNTLCCEECECVFMCVWWLVSRVSVAVRVHLQHQTHRSARPRLWRTAKPAGGRYQGRAFGYDLNIGNKSNDKMKWIKYLKRSRCERFWQTEMWPVQLFPITSVQYNIVAVS